MAITNGTAGNDTLFGTSGADTINGFAGNDWITGDEGNDLAKMGAGNDVFFWFVGDGSDTVLGQDGFDTVVLNCTGTPETITIGRNAARAIVSHSSGTTMDLDDVERIYVQALVGTDTVTIDDLAGTDVTQVLIDLASLPGVGKGGDGELDTVVRNGGVGGDIIDLALVSGNVSIKGPSTEVIVRNADSGDLLEMYGLAGDDTINASKLLANVMRLSIAGGTGNDTITGSQGNDLLQGEDGNDVVVGAGGNDFVDLGAGNDLFAWSVGDGSDTIQGGDGIDTLLITGTQGDNSFLFSGNLSIDGVERVKVRALAGTDSILVPNLAGSDVSAVDIDLAATATGTMPDAAFDQVTVVGTLGADVVEVTWSGNKIVVSGLAANVSIAHAGANDELNIAGSLGGDLIDASGVPAGKISMMYQVKDADTIVGSAGNDRVSVFSDGSSIGRVYLGAGNDIFDGSDGNDVAHMGDGNDLINGGGGNDIGFLGAGNDVMNGGAGNDLAYLGAGDDRYNWRAGGGSDTVDGGAGFDTFDYRAADSLTDAFTIEAETSRVRFSRASEVIRLTSVERLQVMAGWGADFITVKDLANTGMKLVAIDLAASVGSVVGDGSSDIVALEGTAGSDLITVGKFAGGLSVTGLAAQVTITHADNGGLPTDVLTISAGEGNDTINAAAMPDVLATQFNGGNGNDSIVGGACTDTLSGGDGNDTLSGGANLDALYGEAGNDRLLGGASRDQLFGGADNDFLDGGLGNDTLDGGLGNDVLIGGRGNDEISCGDGADRIRYTSVLDGHDVILDFDGDPTGGQDVLDLDALFDSLGIAASKRAGLVNINDLGSTVEISVNVDGKAGFELLIATLNTVDVITKGQDVFVGT